MKFEISEKSKELIIELAKELGVEFPKEKTCEDCFHCKKDFPANTIGKLQNYCWQENKVTITPCDLDDMSHMDYTNPFLIEDVDEAKTCEYFTSGIETYKRMYEDTKKELEDLKAKIKDLCG